MRAQRSSLIMVGKVACEDGLGSESVLLICTMARSHRGPSASRCPTVPHTRRGPLARWDTPSQGFPTVDHPRRGPHFWFHRTPPSPPAALFGEPQDGIVGHSPAWDGVNPLQSSHAVRRPRRCRWGESPTLSRGACNRRPRNVFRLRSVPLSCRPPATPQPFYLIWTGCCHSQDGNR